MNGASKTNPLYSPARPSPGQLEIEVGTHHICPTCGNSHIWNCARCALDFRILCVNCGGWTDHTEATRQQELAAQYVIRCRQRKISDFYTFDFYTRRTHEVIILASTGEVVYAPNTVDRETVLLCQQRVYDAQERIEASRQRRLF